MLLAWRFCVHRRLMGATSMLSCQSACKPYVTYRNRSVADGGYSATFDDLCPTGVKRCIKIESFYPGPYR